MSEPKETRKDQDKPPKLKTRDKIWVGAVIVAFLVLFALIILFGAIIF
jgi:hypothetical protein